MGWGAGEGFLAQAFGTGVWHRRSGLCYAGKTRAFWYWGGEGNRHFFEQKA